MKRRKKQKLTQVKNNKLRIEEIDVELIKIFREHIGKENMIFLDEIFYLLVGEMEDRPYEGYFWRDVIIKRMRLLRRKGKCFITCQQGGYFVLRTQDEADYYKDILRREIKAIKGSLFKADEWVEKELWRKI